MTEVDPEFKLIHARDVPSRLAELYASGPARTLLMSMAVTDDEITAPLFDALADNAEAGGETYFLPDGSRLIITTTSGGLVSTLAAVVTPVEIGLT